jgi:aspartokinase
MNMNIQDVVRKYVDENPHVKNTLRNDLVNLSKLSRLIIPDKKLKENDFDAVLIALRRIKDSLKKISFSKINKLLRETSSRIENKISVYITDNYVHPETISDIKKLDPGIMIIEGYSGKTIITSDKNKEFIEKKLKNNILKIQDNQIKITLVSPENLEIIPGVISHIYSLLSENNINITETMSCFKDTILIINENDLNKALDLLS